MFLYLLLSLCLVCVSCNQTTTEPEIITAAILKEPENVTQPTTMHRIIQPSQSQTQEVNLKVPPANLSVQSDSLKHKEFKPSPALETYYEHNRYPVVPAHPEAKTFSADLKIPLITSLPWQEQKKKDDVWHSNIRFPQTHPVTVNDHPYPYTKDVAKSPSSISYPNYPTYNNKHTEISKYPIDHKFSSYGESLEKPYKNKPKTGYYEEDRHTELTSSPFPWKKIIKILTAFIPIGLLISALTPSVITITPVNGTYSRARSEIGNPDLSLPSSLMIKGCEERIFCELLLSAEETGKSESAAENLLENYMQSNGNPEKLKRIYKAIKNGNCNSLHCDQIKDN